MTTTRQQIEEWAKRGIAGKNKYMVILCDTFDWTDYPHFCSTLADVRQKYMNPGSMQKVMESYNLQEDLDSQLRSARAHVDWGKGAT